MQSLTLFIPGLLPAKDLSEQDIPSLGSIEKLLGCADRELLEPFGFSDALCMLFNLSRQQDHDFPIAAVTRLVDDEGPYTGIWMRADPVHLAPDQHGLILMDETTFTLDQHDALVLAADIRDIFSEMGMALEVPRTNRWYIGLESLPQIKTTPIHEVIGRDIHPFMPLGVDRSRWYKLFNDIQMAMHSNRINQERQFKNDRTVNSIWCWGAGELPEITDCSWTRVFSDEEIAHGLSSLAGVPCQDLPSSLADTMSLTNENDDVLTVISFGMRHNQFADIKGWQDFVAYLEEFWFYDIIKAVKEREIRECTLLSEHQQFTLNKSSLYKFWKKQRSMSDYVD